MVKSQPDRYLASPNKRVRFTDPLVRVGNDMAAFLRVTLILLVFAGASCVAARDLDLRRFEEFAHWSERENLLVDDLSDGNLDQYSPLEAALVIGGYEDEQIAVFLAQLNGCAAKCRDRLHAATSRQARLRVVFEHLSADFLQGKYQADLYDVGRTISFGDFNCLTATILFQTLCRSFAIEIEAIWEPSHVRCWSSLSPDSGYLVETTAGQPKDAVGPMTLQSGLKARVLSDTQLIAKVFYNRGVRMMKSGDYSVALVSTWASCQLDSQDQPAQSNLRACLNNWALAAVSADDLRLADRLLDRGLRLDPTYEPFTRNRSILFGQ